MPWNVYVTRPIPQAGIDLLKPHCRPLEIGPDHPPLSKLELLDAVRGRDGVLCTIGQTFDAEVFAVAAPACRVLANFGVGIDHIDVAAAAHHGIVVTHTPGVLTEATADLTWALLLAAARRVIEGDRLVRSGRWTGWDPMQLHGLDVHGATLGIVGAGRIGTAVARRATGFDMHLLYVDSQARPEIEAICARRVDLHTCLRESDFFSLHVPLTERTRHMISATELHLMKPTAVLINTSRGPVMDEAALVTALRARRIAAVALDVYEHEPQLTPGLAELDNVVCLPHLGSATGPTRSRMAEMAAADLLAVLSGRPPRHPVRV